jgi:hypothetical protein
MMPRENRSAFSLYRFKFELTASAATAAGTEEEEEEKQAEERAEEAEDEEARCAANCCSCSGALSFRNCLAIRFTKYLNA